MIPVPAATRVWLAGRSCQGHLLGQPGCLPLLQTPREGTLSLALAGRGQGGGEPGPARHAARADRMAGSAELLASTHRRMMHFAAEDIHKAGDAWQALVQLAGRFRSAG